MRVRLISDDFRVDVEHDGPYSPDAMSELVSHAWNLWTWAVAGEDEDAEQ